MRIFISSVQKEFARERKALGDYLSGDPLLRRFFDTFVFERDIPASDRRPDAVYLDEVACCDLYIGLFGKEYGWENAQGRSPTLLEFDQAPRHPRRPNCKLFRLLLGGFFRESGSNRGEQGGLFQKVRIPGRQPSG